MRFVNVLCYALAKGFIVFNNALQCAEALQMLRSCNYRHRKHYKCFGAAVAAQIAEALQVSLDYLVGNTDLLLDKTIIKRIQDIQKLETEEKGHLFALMDAFLRDTKTKHAYK